MWYRATSQLVLEKSGDLVHVERSLATPEPGYALVKVVESGICGSDLRLFREHSARVDHWGHEVLGTVEDGSCVPGHLLGTTVVTRTTSACGACIECERCRYSLCRQWSRLAFNGFAELLVLPISHLIPTLTGDQHAPYVLTEPTYVALDLLRCADVPGSGDRVVVVGAGAIGLLTAFVALRHYRREVLLVTRRPASGGAKLAASWGAEVIDDMSWRSRTYLRNCAVAIVTAPYECVPAAVPNIRFGGRIVYNGINSFSRVELDLLDLHVHRISLIPSFPHPQHSFEEAMRVVFTYREELGRLITHRFRFSEARAAFDVLVSPGREAIKVLLTP